MSSLSRRREGERVWRRESSAANWCACVSQRGVRRGGGGGTNLGLVPVAPRARRVHPLPLFRRLVLADLAPPAAPTPPPHLHVALAVPFGILRSEPDGERLQAVAKGRQHDAEVRSAPPRAHLGHLDRELAGAALRQPRAGGVQQLPPVRRRIALRGARVGGEPPLPRAAGEAQAREQPPPRGARRAPSRQRVHLRVVRRRIRHKVFRGRDVHRRAPVAEEQAARGGQREQHAAHPRAPDPPRVDLVAPARAPQRADVRGAVRRCVGEKEAADGAGEADQGREE
ncbi:hypothetical protein DFJ74DRAFT_657229 [Hyaloraphidium curvatum]|nr:hypothetical protein DFJ74DRAFT_657229 [Hyaloraphidium curvatum]